MSRTHRRPTPMAESASPSVAPPSDEHYGPASDVPVHRPESETPYLDALREQFEAEGAGGELEQRLTTALIAPSPEFARLDALVATADVAERQAAYRSESLQRAIAASALPAAQQLALSTALAEGSLTWGGVRVGHRCSDFFEYFGMNDAKGPPPPMNEMNCYELVLYSAWRLGQITTAWIVQQYDEGGELQRPTYEDLGYRKELPVLNSAAGAMPAVGDFVFVTHAGEQVPWHVVLALGGDTAMSLWSRPTPDTPASRVSVSAYVARGETVQYGPPSWQ